MAEQTIALKTDATTTLATALVDQVGSNIIPVTKLVIGADDTNDGFVSSANPLPVSGAVTVASLPLPTGAATAARQDTGNTALAAIQSAVELLDNAVSGNEFQVDVLTMPTVAVTGTFWQATQPVSLAAAVTIQDGGGAITVDNGGTFAVQAAQSGTWTVDLGATDNAVLDAIAASLAGALTVGTHAVTQSGTWTVTGTGGTFPVTDSGGTLTVDAPVGTPVFVRLSDGAAAITTLPVSLASVPSHAVTNAGTFAVQVDGTALTRLTDIETNTDSLAVVGNGAAATAVRVTLANDSTGIVALTTSTASIGKLAANSGVDIGDVDVTSLPAITLAAAQTLATVSTVTAVSDAQVQGKAAEDAALSGNPVRMGARASAAIPSAMSADGDVVTPWADLHGRQIVREQCGTGTTTQVADTASSATLLSANTSRKGCSIQNTSSAVLYIKTGATATATDFTARLVQYAYWESPYGYTGRVDGIWSSDPGDGSAVITEYT